MINETKTTEFTIFHKVAYEDWETEKMYKYNINEWNGQPNGIYCWEEIGSFKIDESDSGWHPHEIELEECEEGYKTHFTCKTTIAVTTAEEDAVMEKMLQKLLGNTPAYKCDNEFFQDIEIDYDSKPIDFEAEAIARKKWMKERLQELKERSEANA